MTTIRLLSAGLVATAMLIAPAMARQHHVTPRHQTESIDPPPRRALATSAEPMELMEPIVTPLLAWVHLRRSPGIRLLLANPRWDTDPACRQAF